MSDKPVTPEGEGWGHADDVSAPAAPSVLEEAIPAERWRRFTPPAAIEDSFEDVVVEDGMVSRAADVTWPKEVIEKIRTGYQCLKCWEPQQDPFPMHCSVCGYRMRANQPADFEEEFRGDKWVGPTVSLEEHLDILADKSERKVHKSGSSIIVPSWADV